MGKVCSKCKEWKTDDEYYVHSESRLRADCKECNNEYTKQRLEARRAARYGVTDDWYDAQYELQEGKCPICKESPESFVVDHDHRCCPGKTSCGLCVRALLCGKCNRGLGHFYDDPEIIRKAVAYLNRHKPWKGDNPT